MKMTFFRQLSGALHTMWKLNPHSNAAVNAPNSQGGDEIHNRFADGEKIQNTLSKRLCFGSRIVGLMLMLHILPAAAADTDCLFAGEPQINQPTVEHTRDYLNNLQPGDTITVPQYSYPHPIICDVPTPQNLWLYPPSLATTTQISANEAPGAAVYPSRVPGIGYAIYAKLIDGNRVYVPLTNSPIKVGTVTNGSHYELGVLFVKTGRATINFGVNILLTHDDLGSLLIANDSAQVTAKRTNIRTRGAVLVVTGSTCRVENDGDIPVDMPTKAASDFGGYGSTTGDRDFNIQLRCDPGLRLSIMLSDATNAANTSTTLTISPGASAATGLGIQLLHENTLISFGPESSNPNSPNSWPAIPSVTPDGVVTIPLKARYVKIAPTITPGVVQAKATFTLSYQ